MSEKLILQIAVLLKNLLGIFAFILLAIFFNKWWLSLLSILFMTDIVESKNEDKKIKTIKDNK